MKDDFTSYWAVNVSDNLILHIIPNSQGRVLSERISVVVNVGTGSELQNCPHLTYS